MSGYDCDKFRSRVVVIVRSCDCDKFKSGVYLSVTSLGEEWL